MASTIPDEFVPLQAAHAIRMCLTRAGLRNPGATRGEMVDSERQNRTTPRTGALTPGVPSGPRPQSGTSGEDYHQW